MILLDELLREHPHFSLPTQFRLGVPLGATTLCFQNYYEQLFPDRDTPVDLYVVCFGENGEQLDGTVLRIETGEAVQYTPDSANLNGNGLIAAMAVPAFDIAAYSAGKFKIRSQIGTGFYVIWDDSKGHIDTMHEWMSVLREPLPFANHYFVFDSGQAKLERFGLAVVNPASGAGWESRPSVSIYNSARRLLGAGQLDAIAPMGARIVFLDKMFPDLGGWFSDHGALGVQLSGANLVEPLTVEVHRSGDLHIHHIN
jgi:hypothetical protein